MKPLSVLVTISACLIAASQAIAAPINVTASRQVVIGDAGGSLLGSNSVSAALGGFVDDVSTTFLIGPSILPKPVDAEAHQDSNINAGAGTFTGVGSVGVGYNAQQSDGIYADSFFDVFFELTLSHSYALRGQLNASADGGRAESYFQLLDSSSTAVIDFDAITNNNTFLSPVDLASFGILAPGTYHLVVASIFDNCVDSRASTGTNNPCGPLPDGFMGTDVNSTNFNFAMQLTEIPPPIPVPAALPLFVSGLLGLGVMARRRKTRTART